MYRYLKEQGRKEALTNLDIKWLVNDGLWSFKVGLLSLREAANYLLEVYKWANERGVAK
jgi:hypothetical protein